MRFLKLAAFGLVALFALATIAGFLMPSKWEVQESITIAAAPETVYGFVGTTREWQQWAAWNKEMDPDSEWTYSGANVGVGSTMSWKGPKLGQGTLTLTEAHPKSGVRYEMKMEGEYPAQGSLLFKVVDGRTQVTWTDAGDLGANPYMHLFVPMMTKMLHQHFALGLKNLERVSVERQKALDEAAKQAGKEPEPVAGDDLLPGGH